MASKAARQEPTGRGYHTGLYVEARELPVVRCVLSRKMQERHRRLRFSANIKKEVSGCGRGTGSCLEKAWPVVDEQSKNCAGDYESENHGPPVILGEVWRQELCFR